METDERPFLTTISKAELNDLPLGRWDGPVTVVNRDDAVPAACEALAREDLLGFDTESRPSFRKGQNFPVSLLQLAGEAQVYLFQIRSLKNVEPIRALLESPRILKAGVAVHDDIRRLAEVLPFEARGFVELARIAREAEVEKTGLRSLAGIFLGLRISKSAQLSNWAKSKLSESQVSYAATDAWISRRLYERLVELDVLAANK